MANKAFDKIEYNNNTYLPQIPFVTGPSTDTTAGTWTGTIGGIDTYADGLIILYKPAIAGASTTTLNLNSLGAKTIYINNTTKLTTHFPKNQPILLVYSTSQNSGCWMCIDNYWTDSNTVPQAYCGTEATTAAKAASMTYYTATAKSYVMVNFRYANSVQGAITLNINSTGAKPIYINGAASSSSNYTLPAASYLVYYDGTNYYFRTDGKITGTTTGNLTDAGVTKVTTTAGTHTAISNATGAVSFNVPTIAEHVGAVADCTLSLYNGAGGNPGVAKFCTVNYTGTDSNNGVLFKTTFMAGHGNGVSYNHLQDAIISVSYTGAVSVDIYRYYAQSVTYSGTTRYYGDILYTVDTTNKIVTFYTLMGQYSTTKFSPYKRLNASSAGTITQHTGTAAMGASGTTTFANVYWLNGTEYLKKISTYPLILNASDAQGNYDEGIRINVGKNNYSTLLFGGTVNSTTGTNPGAWWLGVNNTDYPRKLMIAHNGSGATGTYFYTDSDSQVTPSLNIGGKLNVNDTATMVDLNTGTLNVSGFASFAGGTNLITASTSDITAGSTPLANGRIYCVYE